MTYSKIRAKALLGWPMTRQELCFFLINATKEDYKLYRKSLNV